MKRHNRKLTTKNKLVLAIVAVLAVSILSTGVAFAIIGGNQSTPETPSTSMDGAVVDSATSGLNYAAGTAVSDGSLAGINAAGSVSPTYTVPDGATAISSLSALQSFISGSDTYGYLTADITVASSSSRTNVSSGTLASTQTLDGNGHTITFTSSTTTWGTMSNITTHTPSGVSGTTYVEGFLMAVNNGTIRNLNITVDGTYKVNNGSYSSYNIAVGLFAAENGSTGVIENCYAHLTSNTTLNVHSNGAASSTAKVYSGGIVGTNAGTIEYCSVVNDVADTQTSTYGSTAYGGIAAFNTGTVAYCTFAGSGLLNGPGTSTSAAIGGIVGINSSGTIKMCHNAFTGSYSISNTAKSIGLIAGTYSGNATNGWTASHSATLSVNNGATKATGTYAWSDITTMVGSGTTPTVDGGKVYVNTPNSYEVYYDFWAQSSRLYIALADAADISSATTSNMDFDQANSILSKSFDGTTTFHTGSTYIGASAFQYTGYKSALAFGSPYTTYKSGGQTTVDRTGTKITSSTTFPLHGGTNYYLEEDVTIDLSTQYVNNITDYYYGTFNGNGYTITFTTSSAVTKTGTSYNSTNDGAYGIITNLLGDSDGVNGVIKNVTFVFNSSVNFSSTVSATNLKGCGIITGRLFTSAGVSINNVKLDIQSGASITLGTSSGNAYVGLVAGGIYGGTSGRLYNTWVNLDGTVNVATGSASAAAWGGALWGYAQDNQNLNASGGYYLFSGNGTFKSSTNTTGASGWTTFAAFGCTLGGDYNLFNGGNTVNAVYWDWGWNLNNGQSGNVKFVGGRYNYSSYESRQWIGSAAQLSVTLINVSNTYASGAFGSDNSIGALGAGSRSGTFNAATNASSNYGSYSIEDVLIDGVDPVIPSTQKIPGTSTAMTTAMAAQYVGYSYAFSSPSAGLTTAAKRTVKNTNLGYVYNTSNNIQLKTTIVPTSVWTHSFDGNAPSQNSNYYLSNLATYTKFTEVYGASLEGIASFYTEFNKAEADRSADAQAVLKVAQLNQLSSITASGLTYTYKYSDEQSNRTTTTPKDVGAYWVTNASTISGGEHLLYGGAIAQLIITPKAVTFKSSNNAAHAIYRADDTTWLNASVHGETGVYEAALTDFYTSVQSTSVCQFVNPMATSGATSLWAVTLIEGLVNVDPDSRLTEDKMQGMIKIKLGQTGANLSPDLYNSDNSAISTESNGSGLSSTSVKAYVTVVNIGGIEYTAIEGAYNNRYTIANTTSAGWVEVSSSGGHIHARSETGAVQINYDAKPYQQSSAGATPTKASTATQITSGSTTITSIYTGNKQDDIFVERGTTTVASSVTVSNDEDAFNAGLPGTYNITLGSSSSAGYSSDKNLYYTGGSTATTVVLVIDKYLLGHDNATETVVYGNTMPSSAGNIVKNGITLDTSNCSVVLNIGSGDYSTAGLPKANSTGYTATTTLSDDVYQVATFGTGSNTANNGKTITAGKVVVTKRPISVRRLVKNTYLKTDIATNPITSAEYNGWLGTPVGVMEGDVVSTASAVSRYNSGQYTALDGASITTAGFYTVNATVDTSSADYANYSASGSAEFMVYVSDGTASNVVVWSGSSDTIATQDNYVTNAGNVITGYTIAGGYRIGSSSDLTTFLSNANIKYGYLATDVTVTSAIDIAEFASGRTLDGNGYTLTIDKSSSGLNGLTATSDYNSIYTTSKSTNSWSLLMRVNKGTVKNLKVKVKASQEYYYTASAATNHDTFGIIAGINAGTIENVAVEIPAGVSVKFRDNNSASPAAGIYLGAFAGINMGKISYSTVTINGTLALTNDSDQGLLGGIAGVNVGGTIEYCIADGSGTLNNGSAAGNSGVGGIVGAGASTSGKTIGYLNLTPGTIQMVYSNHMFIYVLGNNMPCGFIAGHYYGNGTNEVGWFGFYKTTTGLYNGNHGSGTIASQTMSEMIGNHHDTLSSVLGGRMYFNWGADADVYFDYWTRSDKLFIQFANAASISEIKTATGTSSATVMSVDNTQKIAYISKSAINAYRNTTSNYYGTSDVNYNSTYDKNMGYGSVSYAENSTFRAPTNSNSGISTSTTVVSSALTLPLSGSTTYYMLDDVYIDLNTQYTGSSTQLTFSGTLYGNGHTIYLTTNGKAITKTRNISSQMGIITDIFSGGHIENVTFAFVDCNFTLVSSNTSCNAGGVFSAKVNLTNSAATTLYGVKFDIQSGSTVKIQSANTSYAFNTGIISGWMGDTGKTTSNTTNIGNIWINNDGHLIFQNGQEVRFGAVTGYLNNSTNTVKDTSSNNFIFSGSGQVEFEGTSLTAGSFIGYATGGHWIDYYASGSGSVGIKGIYWNWDWEMINHNNAEFAPNVNGAGTGGFTASYTSIIIDSVRGGATMTGGGTGSNTDTNVSSSYSDTYNINQYLGKSGVGNDVVGAYSDVTFVYSAITSSPGTRTDFARYQDAGYVIESNTVKMATAVINADDARAGYQYGSTSLIDIDYLNVSKAWLTRVKNETAFSDDGDSTTNAYDEYINSFGGSAEDIAIANEYLAYAQSLSFGRGGVSVSYSGLSTATPQVTPYTITGATLDGTYNVGVTSSNSTIGGAGLVLLGQFLIIPKISVSQPVSKVYDGTTSTTDGNGVTFKFKDGSAEVADANLMLVNTKPSDWDSVYNTYYKASGSTYALVSGDSAPYWAANTYYLLVDGKSAYDLYVNVTVLNPGGSCRYYDDQGNFYDRYAFYMLGSNNTAFAFIPDGEDPVNGSTLDLLAYEDSGYITPRPLTVTLQSKGAANGTFVQSKYYDTADGVTFRQVYQYYLNNNSAYTYDFDKMNSSGISGAISGETVTMALTNANLDNVVFDVTNTTTGSTAEPSDVGTYNVSVRLSTDLIRANGTPTYNYYVQRTIMPHGILSYQINAVGIYVPTMETGTDYREYTAGKQHFAAPIENDVTINEVYYKKSGSTYTGKLIEQWQNMLGLSGTDLATYAQLKARDIIYEAKGGDGGASLAVAYVYVGNGGVDADGYTFVNQQWSGSGDYATFATNSANAGYGAISTDGAINVGEYVYLGYSTNGNFYAPTNIFEELLTLHSTTYAKMITATVYGNGRFTDMFLIDNSSFEELGGLLGATIITENGAATALQNVAKYDYTGTSFADFSKFWDGSKYSNTVFIERADVSIYAEDQAIEYGQNLKDESVLDNRSYVISELPDAMSMDAFKDTLDKNGFKFAVSEEYIIQNGTRHNVGTATELWVLPVKFDTETNMTAWRNAIVNAPYVDYNLNLTIIAGNLTVYQKEITVEWKYMYTDNASKYDAERHAYVYDGSQYTIAEVAAIYGVLANDTPPAYNVVNQQYGTNVGVYDGFYVTFDSNQSNNHWKNYYFGDGVEGRFEIIHQTVQLNNVTIEVSNGSSWLAVASTVYEIPYSSSVSVRINITNSDSNQREGIKNIGDNLWLSIGSTGDETPVVVNNWAVTTSGNTVTFTGTANLSGLTSTLTPLGYGIERFTSGNYTYYNNTSGNSATAYTAWIIRDTSVSNYTDGVGVAEGSTSFDQGKSVTYANTSQKAVSDMTTANANFASDSSLGQSGVIMLNSVGATYSFDSVAKYQAMGEAIRYWDYQSTKKNYYRQYKDFGSSKYGININDGGWTWHNGGAIANILYWVNVSSTNPEIAEGLRTGKYYLDIDGVWVTIGRMNAANWGLSVSGYNRAYLTMAVYGIENPYSQDIIDCTRTNATYLKAGDVINTHGYNIKSADVYCESGTGFTGGNQYGKNNNGSAVDLMDSSGLYGSSAYRVAFMASALNYKGNHGSLEMIMHSLSITLRERTAVETTVDQAAIDNSPQYMPYQAHRLEDGNIAVKFTAQGNASNYANGLNLANIALKMNSTTAYSDSNEKTLTLANGGLILTDTVYKRLANGKMVLYEAEVKTDFARFGNKTMEDCYDYTVSGFYLDAISYGSQEWTGTNYIRNDSVQYYIDTYAPEVYISDVDNTSYGNTDREQYFADGAVYGGWTIEGTKHVQVTAEELAQTATGSNGSPANRVPMSGLVRFEYSETADFAITHVVPIVNGKAVVSLTISAGKYYYFKATDANGNVVIKALYYNTNDRKSDLNLTIVGNPSEFDSDTQKDVINNQETVDALNNYAKDNLTSYVENTWTNKSVLMRLAGFGEGNSLARIYYRRIYTSREVDRTVASVVEQNPDDEKDTATVITTARQLKLWLYGYYEVSDGSGKIALSDKSYAYQYAKLGANIDLNSSSVMNKIFSDVERLERAGEFEVYPSLSEGRFTIGSSDGTILKFAYGDSIPSGYDTFASTPTKSQGIISGVANNGAIVEFNLNTQTLSVWKGDQVYRFYYGASAVAFELAKGRVLDGQGYTLTMQQSYWLGSADRGSRHNGVTLNNRVQDTNTVALSSLEKTIVTGSFLVYNNGTIKNVNFATADDLYVRVTQNTVYGIIAGINKGTISNTTLTIGANTEYNVHSYGLDFKQTMIVGAMTGVNEGYLANNTLTISTGAKVQIRPNVDVDEAVGNGNWDEPAKHGETDAVYGGFAAVNSSGVIENNTLKNNGEVTLKCVEDQGRASGNNAYAGMYVGVVNTATANLDLIKELGIVVKGNTYTTQPVVNNTISSDLSYTAITDPLTGKTYNHTVSSGGKSCDCATTDSCPRGLYYVEVDLGNGDVYNPLFPGNVVTDRGNFKGVGIAYAYTADDINYGWTALQTEEWGNSQILVLDHTRNWYFEHNGVYSLEIKIESGTGIDRYIIAESNGNWYYNTGEFVATGIDVQAIEVEDSQISEHNNVIEYKYTGTYSSLTGTSAVSTDATNITIQEGQYAEFKYTDNDYARIQVSHDANGMYYIINMFSGKTTAETICTQYYLYPVKYDGKTYVELHIPDGTTMVLGTLKGSDYDVTESYVNGRGFFFDWKGSFASGTASAVLSDTIVSSLSGSEFKQATEVGRFNVKIDKRQYNIAFETEVDIEGVDGVEFGKNYVQTEVDKYIDYTITENSVATQFENTLDINSETYHQYKYFVLWDVEPSSTVSTSQWTLEYNADYLDRDTKGWVLNNRHVENETEISEYYVPLSLDTTTMTVTLGDSTTIGHLLKSYQVNTSTENDPTSWAEIDLNTIKNDQGTEDIDDDVWYGIDEIETHRLGDTKNTLPNFNGTEWVMTEVGADEDSSYAINWKRTAAINVKEDEDSDLIRDVNLVITVQIKYYASYNISIKEDPTTGEKPISTEYGEPADKTYMYYKNPSPEQSNDVTFEKGYGTNLDNMWATEAEFYAVDLTADDLYYNTSSYQTYHSETVDGVTTYKTDKLLVAKGIRNITDFYEINIYDVAEELQVNSLTPAGDHHIVLKSATLGNDAKNYILNFRVADYYTVTKSSIRVDFDNNFGKLYDGTAGWSISQNMVRGDTTATGEQAYQLDNFVVDGAKYSYVGSQDEYVLGDMNTGRYVAFKMPTTIAVDQEVTVYDAVNDVDKLAGRVVEVTDGRVTAFTGHGYTYNIDANGNVTYNGVVRGNVEGGVAKVYTLPVNIDYGYFMVRSGGADVATPNVGGELKLFLGPNNSYQFGTVDSADNYVVSQDLPVYTGASLVIENKTKVGDAVWTDGVLTSVKITYRHNDYAMTTQVNGVTGYTELVITDVSGAHVVGTYANGIITMDNQGYAFNGRTYTLEEGATAVYEATEGWSAVQLGSSYAKLYKRAIYVQGSAGNGESTVSVVFNGSAQATSAATGVEEVTDYDVLTTASGSSVTFNGSLVEKGWYGTLVGENAMFAASMDGTVNVEKPILAGSYAIKYNPSTLTTSNVKVTTIETSNAAVNTNSLAANYYVAGVVRNANQADYETTFTIKEAESMLSINRVVAEDGSRYVILVTVTGLAHSWDGLAFLNAGNDFTLADGSDLFIDAMQLLEDNRGQYDFSLETPENRSKIAEYNALIAKDKNSVRAQEIATEIQTSIAYLWQSAVGQIFRVGINGAAGFAAVLPSMSTDSFGNFKFDLSAGKLTFEYYGNANLDAYYVSDRYSIKVAGKEEAVDDAPGNKTFVNSSNVASTKSALSDGQINLEEHVRADQTSVDLSTTTFISTAKELLAWLNMTDSTAQGYANGVLTTNIIGFDWEMNGSVGGASKGLESGRTLNGNGYSVELVGNQISSLTNFTMHLADENLDGDYKPVQTEGTIKVGGVFVQYIAAGAQIKNVNFVYTANRYYKHLESIGTANLAIGIIAGMAKSNAANSPALDNVTLEIRGRLGYLKAGGMGSAGIVAMGGMVGIAASTNIDYEIMKNCSVYYYKAADFSIPAMDIYDGSVKTGQYDVYLRLEESENQHVAFGGFIGALSNATITNVSVRTEENSAGEVSSLYVGAVGTAANIGGWIFAGGGIGVSRDTATTEPKQYKGKANGYINKFNGFMKVENKNANGESYAGSIGGVVSNASGSMIFTNTYSYYSQYTNFDVGSTASKTDANNNDKGLQGFNSLNKGTKIAIVESTMLQMFNDEAGYVDYYFGSNNYHAETIYETVGELNKESILNYTSTVFINDNAIAYDPYATGWQQGTVIYSSYLRQAEYQVGTIDKTLTPDSGTFSINGVTVDYTQDLDDTLTNWTVTSGDTIYTVDIQKYVIKNTVSGSTFYFGMPDTATDSSILKDGDDRINIEVLAPNGKFIWDYHLANYTNTLTDQGAVTRLVWNIDRGTLFSSADNYQVATSQGTGSAEQGKYEHIAKDGDSGWDRAWNAPVLGQYSISTTDSGTTVFEYPYTGEAITDTISVTVHVNYTDPNTNQIIDEIYTASVKPTEDMIDVGAYPIGEASGLPAGMAGVGTTNYAKREKALTGGVSSSQILLVISPKELPYVESANKTFDDNSYYYDATLVALGTEAEEGVALALTYDNENAGTAKIAYTNDVVVRGLVDADGYFLSLIPTETPFSRSTDLVTDTDAKTVVDTAHNVTYRYNTVDGTNVLYNIYGYEVGTFTLNADGTVASISGTKVYELNHIAYVGGNGNSYLDKEDPLPSTFDVASIKAFYYAYLQIATIESMPYYVENNEVPSSDSHVAIINMTMVENTYASKAYLVASVVLEGAKAHNFSVYGTTVRVDSDTTYSVNGNVRSFGQNVVDTATKLLTINDVNGLPVNYLYNATDKTVLRATQATGGNWEVDTTLESVVGHAYVEGGVTYLNVYNTHLNQASYTAGAEVWWKDDVATLKAQFATGGAFAGKGYSVEASIDKRYVSVQYDNLLHKIDENKTASTYAVPTGAIVGVATETGDYASQDTLTAQDLGLDQLGLTDEEITAALDQFKAYIEGIKVQLQDNLSDYTTTKVFSVSYEEKELTFALSDAANIAIFVTEGTAERGQIKNTANPWLIFSRFAGEEVDGEAVTSEGTDRQALVISTTDDFDALMAIQDTATEGSADQKLSTFNFVLNSDVALSVDAFIESVSKWGTQDGAVFDGRGHVISGLGVYSSVTTADSETIAAIFDISAQNVTIKDVIFTNVVIGADGTKASLFHGATAENVIVQGEFWQFNENQTLTNEEGVLYEISVSTATGDAYYIGEVSNAIATATGDDKTRYEGVIEQILEKNHIAVVDGRNGTSADKAIVINNVNDLRTALLLPTLHFVLGANITMTTSTWNSMTYLFEKDKTARTQKISLGGYTVNVNGNTTPDANLFA